MKDLFMKVLGLGDVEATINGKSVEKRMGTMRTCDAMCDKYGCDRVPRSPFGNRGSTAGSIGVVDGKKVVVTIKFR